MTQSAFTVSWREDICSQIGECYSADAYENYLESLKSSESINKKNNVFSEFCEWFRIELAEKYPIIIEEVYPIGC